MPPARSFAALDPGSIESFVERVSSPAKFGAALDRWKYLTREGFDVTALALDAGGQVVELVGLGFRYQEAPAEGARLFA